METLRNHNILKTRSTEFHNIPKWTLHSIVQFGFILVVMFIEINTFYRWNSLFPAISSTEHKMEWTVTVFGLVIALETCCRCFRKVVVVSFCQRFSLLQHFQKKKYVFGNKLLFIYELLAVEEGKYNVLHGRDRNYKMGKKSLRSLKYRLRKATFVTCKSIDCGQELKIGWEVCPRVLLFIVTKLLFELPNKILMSGLKNKNYPVHVLRLYINFGFWHHLWTRGFVFWMHKCFSKFNLV